MSKESLCSYAEKCDFFIKNKNTGEIEKIIIRNMNCRSSKNGWTDCKRFQLYEKGLNPTENIVPKDTRDLNKIEHEIQRLMME